MKVAPFLQGKFERIFLQSMRRLSVVGSNQLKTSAGHPRPTQDFSRRSSYYLRKLFGMFKKVFEYEHQYIHNPIHHILYQYNMLLVWDWKSDYLLWS